MIEKTEVVGQERETALAQINHAIEYYQTHGWIPGKLGTLDGDRCIAGALMAAPETWGEGYITWGWGHQIWSYLDSAAHAMGFASVDYMVEWNNESARTKPEIVARLEAGRDKLLMEGVEAGV